MTVIQTNAREVADAICSEHLRQYVDPRPKPPLPNANQYGVDVRYKNHPGPNGRTIMFHFVTPAKQEVHIELNIDAFALDPVKTMHDFHMTLREASAIHAQRRQERESIIITPDKDLTIGGIPLAGQAQQTRH